MARHSGASFQPYNARCHTVSISLYCLRALILFLGQQGYQTFHQSNISGLGAPKYNRSGATTGGSLTTIPLWSGEHRGFAVTAFTVIFPHLHSEFHGHFHISRSVPVLSRPAISVWVFNLILTTTGQTVLRRGGSAKTVRTPENVDAGCTKQWQEALEDLSE
ncbi:hypothetical protein TNCV_1334201 [Trichonephila clavipes]|nr:hypothetical protein TNCV_1334201 [Trichonephila clavipes]